MKNNSKLKLVSHSIKLSLLLSFSFGAMAANDLSIDTIVVTASGFEQEIKNAPATISVITPEELSKKPYRDITDALKDIPGVNISGGGDATDITIRGMDAKYTLILVDGKKVSTRETRPNSDGSGFEQGWLPPLGAIERIEVVRGPMSSLYGSDAMGGVINIITKKVSDKWQGSVRLESTFQDNSQSKNYYNGSFSLMGPIVADTLGLQLYGQYSDRAEDEFLRGHAAQKLQSINGTLSLNATESQLFELDFGRSLQTSAATVGYTRTASQKDFKRDNRRNALALTHKGSWDYFSSTTFVSYEENKNPKREMEIKNTDFDTQFLVPISNHMLTAGGKYTYQELNDSGNQLNTSLTKIDRWNYALFLEDEWNILDNFSITAGLRFNKDENYGSNWNPRLYSVWNITNDFTLKGGFSTGYTTPSLRHVVANWGQETGGSSYKGIIIGNPDLKPEKSDSFEIGLSYDNDDGLNAAATVFYTKFKDKIQSYYLCDGGAPGNASCSANGVPGFDFVQSRENVDKADLKGLELSLKTPLFDHFLLTSSYTWTKTEQKSGVNKGLSLNRTPRQTFNSQLDWALNDQWDLWAKVAYYGKETVAGRNGVRGKEYPSYTFWDLGANYAVNSQTKLYAGIYNLFDKEVDNTDFGKTLDGRRYWVGVEINF